MSPLAALGLAGLALAVLYTYVALRYRRKTRRLVEEWERYSLEREDGPDGLVAFHVEGQLVDLAAAEPSWIDVDPLTVEEQA